MAIDTVVAGAYAKTYNAVDVGFTKDGAELEFNYNAEEVSESDLYGSTLLDFIYRGIATHKLRFISKVYKPGSLTPFIPWGALGTIATATAPIGRLASAVAAATVLTAVAGTPAAAGGNISTLTASKSILSPHFNGKLLFHTKAREVPIEMVCLPSSDGSGNVTAFSTT